MSPLGRVKKKSFIHILWIREGGTGGQEDRRTGEQEDRRTGGQEDRRTGGQEDRRTGGQEDRRTVFSLGSATFC